VGTPAAILLLWLAFAGSHVALSSARLRPRLVGALGDQRFLGLYSLVALATFFPLCWVYFESRHAGAFLWWTGDSTAVRWLAYVGVAAALALVVGGVSTPSPAGMGALAQPAVRGALRWSRHPVFMGLGLLGLLHLLVARIHVADLLFFAGFPLFAVVGCAHQDARKLRERGESYRELAARTPFLPFTGSEALRGIREAPVAVAVGVALAVALRWLHPLAFGVG